MTTQFGVRPTRVLRERCILAALVFILALMTACLAFGAPAPASPPPPPPVDSGIPSAGSTPADGFHQTAAAFQMFEKKAAALGVVLQKLRAEAEAANPGESAKQQAEFLKKLIEVYPGSNFDGATGTVVLQKGFVATFSNTLTVDRIKEVGAVTVSYLLGQGQIQLSDASSSVTISIDKADPSRSRFSEAVIPVIRDEAERALSVRGYKRTATNSVETAILNDAYQLLSQTDALRMDFFAADVMRYPVLQHRAVQIAGKGYRERHPGEYQKGADPAETEDAIGDSTSRWVPIDVVGVVGRLLLICALAAGCYWIVGVMIRRTRFMFMDKMVRQQVEKCNVLAPMVVRSLKKLGTSLWGKNRLWSKKYYIIRRTDRWVLCDGKYDRSGLKSQAKNCLEVCMRDSNFKLKITRINGTGVDMAVTCKDFSQQELELRLTELRTLFAMEKSPPGTTAS